MMSSLVQEIQLEALNPNVRVSDLLRKALVISTKLKVAGDVEWIRSELEGYPGHMSVPPYRVMDGTPQVFNPYHGHVHLEMSPELQKKACAMHIGYSVAEIEKILEKNERMIRLSFSPKAAAALKRAMQVPLEPSVVISPSTFVGALDNVRNRVLMWALELEEAGILGDGLSFSATEVVKAQHVTNNITTNIGSMSNSQLQVQSSGEQALRIEEKREHLSTLLQAIKEASKGTEQSPQVSVDVDTVLVQLESPSPKPGVIGESLRSLRSVLEGAAGGALGNYLPTLVALITSLGLG